MELNQTTPPTAEPLTLAETKLHLRIGNDFTEDDSLINGLISGAREQFEEETGRQLMPSTWEGYLDRFPNYSIERIEVDRPPLSSVNKIEYLDTAGVLQTWDSSKYVVKAFAGSRPKRGLIYPAVDEVYPTTRRIPNSVTVTFVAGYADAASVPSEIKQALLAWIGNRYENRESVIVGTIAAKLPGLDFEPWKRMEFG